MCSPHKWTVVMLLSLAVPTMGAGGSFIYAETVQDAGIPGAVKFEAVFPHLVWGNIGGLSHFVELVLINPTNRRVHYELQLFHPDGSLAKEVLESLSYRDGTLLDDGRLHSVVLANSVWSWFMNPPDLTEEPFIGWAILRADGELQAFWRLNLWDMGPQAGILKVASMASLTAGYQGVRSASLRVQATKEQTLSDFKDPDGKRQQIWEVGTTGVSLVNFGEDSLAVDLTLESGCFDEGLTKELVLGPQRQEAFLVNNLFESFSPDSCDSSGLLKIRSNDGDFSVTALDLEAYKSLNGGFCPASLCLVPYRYMPVYRWDLLWGNSFSFPEEIILRETIGQFEAVLTRFGLILLDAGGEVEGIHAFAYGDANLESQGFLEVPDHQIALVWGRENTPFIFTTSGKVVVAERAQFWGNSILIESTEVEGQIKISQEGCYAPIIVVDLIAEEIVSVSHTWCF